MLAWIPFLEPMTGLMSVWYLLAIPLVVGISMTYKAIRIPERGPWGPEVVIMSLQVVCGIVLMAIFLGLFVSYIIPLLG
tara:strand:- start:42 stop:278 length:237 start_codon:yes stop_codon:yes gene_type:complete